MCFKIINGLTAIPLMTLAGTPIFPISGDIPEYSRCLIKLVPLGITRPFSHLGSFRFGTPSLKVLQRPVPCFHLSNIHPRYDLTKFLIVFKQVPS